MTTETGAATPPPAHALPTERKAWDKGVAPAYINLFLLVAFFDRLAPWTLGVGGFGAALLGLVVAGGLCFALLYYAPAMWGNRVRRPMLDIAAATFGRRAAPWLPGAIMGLAQLLFFAATIALATDVTLRGMIAGGFFDESWLDPIVVGGITVRSHLYLFTSFAWVLASALIGTIAVRLAAAVMSFYPPIPAITLGVTMIWALGGLAHFEPTGLAPAPPGFVRDEATRYGFLMAIQLVFGFFSTAGLAAVDWGAVSRDPRDVRLGGFVGVTGGSIILGTIALVIVAGSVGRSLAPPAPADDQLVPFAGAIGPSETHYAAAADDPAFGAGIYTFRGLYQRVLGGPWGCAALMILSLGMLGPACYTPSVYSRMFGELIPRVPRWAIALVGGILAWPLIATGLALRLEWVFGIVGALVTPVIGAIAADYVRHRRALPGPRRGVNPPGVIAWLVGVAVGLVPIVGPLAGFPAAGRVQPAAVLGFVLAFLVYLALAILRLERPQEEPTPADGG